MEEKNRLRLVNDVTRVIDDAVKETTTPGFVVPADLGTKLSEMMKSKPLPPSLAMSLGDIDVTDLLKQALERRAAEKPGGTLAPVVINNSEMGEVTPGLSINKALVDALFPETAATALADHRERQLLRNQKRREAEMRADMAASKAILDEMLEKQALEQMQKRAAQELLSKSEERQVDKALQFVDVTNTNPRDAAKRILRNKETHPEWDVEPVELSGALDGTTPLTEVHLEALHPIMHVRKHYEEKEVPDEIIFAIPNHDLPMDSALSPSDLAFQQTRYVHLDSMPEELRSVVRLYRSLRRQTGLRTVELFKDAVEKLYRTVKELPTEQPVVVPDDELEFEESNG